MAKARCPGCGDEGSMKIIEGHMRKCPKFTALYQSTSDELLLDPLLAFTAAHPPVEKPPRKVTASGAPSGEVPDLPADDLPPVEPDVAPPDPAVAPPPKDATVKAPRRRGARKTEEPPPLPASGNPGQVVSVEYWDWDPTLLEQLREDIAGG